MGFREAALGFDQNRTSDIPAARASRRPPLSGGAQSGRNQRRRGTAVLRLSAEAVLRSSDLRGRARRVKRRQQIAQPRRKRVGRKHSGIPVNGAPPLGRLSAEDGQMLRETIVRLLITPAASGRLILSRERMSSAPVRDWKERRIRRQNYFLH